ATPEPPPGGGPGGRDANPDRGDACGGPGAVPGGRVSEASCGVQSPGDRGVPEGPGTEAGVECRAAGPRVGRAGPDAPSGLIRDPAGLAKAASALSGWNGPVGLDLETTGLNPARDGIRLLSLATPTETFVTDLFAFADPETALAPLSALLAE